ncbi:hypothetical protein LSTR_LSTR000473 [Laodelphax striatellus]|uniref:RING-type E3 ubiquitin transferase n=1 Tax=Laodelphax striatellus TaxID=195883 RepID=A0A482X1R7_LAOST|nr:hypothetical protein LSTR_LSTR000473 [Laodelphax striatellus]
MEAIAWPRDFPEFKKLDNLLRCGICYDYMKTCMITSCSHNYCSLCIRKYMQYKSVCPACFEETFEVNLRNNRPIDDLISIYCTIRDKLFRHLRLSTVHLQPSQNDVSKPVETCVKDITPESSENFTSPILKSSKSSDIFKKSSKGSQGIKKNLSDAFNQKAAADTKPSTSSKAAEEMPSTSRKSPIKKIPEIFYSPKKTAPPVNSSPANVVKVPCPVCNVDIPERNINGHLDSCLARDGAPKVSNVPSRRSPIPKRVYNMMSDKDLRKWLKTYGLNSIGDKKTLIHRIQRYTVLYNSECDSDHPRSSAEIIRQVETEEKQEKGTANPSMASAVRKINKNSDQKLIEEENKKYLEKNKASFDNLIKTMKERNGTNIKPTKRLNVIADSDESDPEIDSYFSKETMKIDDDRPSSSGYQAKIEDKISKTKKVNFQKETTGMNDDFKFESHFLAQSPSPDLSGNQDESLIDMIELPPESPRRNTRGLKNVHFKEEACDSDESDDSVSLLANCQVVLEENKSSTITTSERADNDDEEEDDLNDEDKIIKEYKQESPWVTESQIVDPDFLITESQLTEAKEDESEDEFTPKRPMKRPKMTVNQKTPTSVKKSTPRSDRKNITPKLRQSRASDSDLDVTKSFLEESSDDTVLELNQKQSTGGDRDANKEGPSSPNSKLLDAENSSSSQSFPDLENVDPGILNDLDIATSRNVPTPRSSLRNKRQRIGSASDTETPKRILRQRTK